MMYQKPVVVGPVDGNVFAVLGACQKALRRAGQDDVAKELASKVFGCDSYDEALQIMLKYVDFDLDG